MIDVLLTNNPLIVGESSTVTELLTSQTIINIAILGFAAFIQATVGFASALFGLPLLLLAGNDLMSSQVLIITAMFPQNVLGAWRLRQSIDYRETVVPALLRIAALPLGVLGLGVVMTWPEGSVNQMVGLIILVALAIQSLVGIEWKTATRWYWQAITFGGSGFLQGLSGMSGPPMVLWVHGQRFKADRARAFLFALYISNYLPQMLLLGWRYGGAVVDAAVNALLAVPLVIAAALMGLRVGSMLGDKWLRSITYVCLLGLAVRSLLDPWIRTVILPWLQSSSSGVS